ncbi:uncharacterized protein LOC106636881 [Copidosoma floridanum]|uniref:uncharacterized protein LOC106636881 n=1 Tax=Copidosoma floridanum TaxID=29053 RepID=UPI000C6FC0DA|nr:uncharacterized protein LOC106636881 [Copidosoma floridanum]
MDLLSEDSDVLQKKITYVQEYVDDIKSALPLLYHSASSLEQLFDSKPGVTCEDSIRNKVKFYKEEWKVENDEVYSLISKYLYCMIHHHDNTVAVIKLLLDKNVTVKSLLKYNWNVLIDSKVAKERLKIYSKFESVLPIKPWILNCKESEFTRKLTTLNEKSIGLLEYSGVVKFLSEKTGYRKKLIEFKLSTRNLQNKTLNQVKLITDLIIKEGYDWHDIVCSIEVLHLSGELIINRFSQLKNINYRPHFLKFLLLSDKDFVEYVNTCKK